MPFRQEQQRYSEVEHKRLSVIMTSLLEKTDHEEVERDLKIIGHDLVDKHGFEPFMNEVNRGCRYYIERLGDNFETLEAALIYAEFFRRNRADNSMLYYDDILGTIARMIRRAKYRGEDTVDPQTRLALVYMFGELEKRLMDTRMMGVSDSVIGAMSPILENNEELLDDMLPMIHNSATSTSPSERHVAWLIVRKMMPFDKQIQVLRGSLKEKKRADTFFISTALNALGDTLRKNDGWRESTLLLSKSEMKLMKQYFTELCAQVDVFEANGHKDILLRSLSEQSRRDRRIRECLTDQMKNELSDYEVRIRDKQERDLNSSRTVSSDYGYVSRIFDTLSPDYQNEILDLFKESDRREVHNGMELVFGRDDTTGYSNDYFYDDDGNLRDCFKKIFANRGINEVISLMADNPKNHLYTLGTIFCLLSVNDLPSDVVRKMKTQLVNHEYRIVPCHNGWNLCCDAEPRMMESLYSGAVILVNGSLLIKFKGKFSAVCTRTFTDKNGFTFVEGNWYSPTDDRDRAKIKEAFARGNLRVQVEGSTWALMRSVSICGENTEEEVYDEISRMVHFLNKRSREVYGADRARFAERNFESD